MQKGSDRLSSTPTRSHPHKIYGLILLLNMQKRNRKDEREKDKEERKRKRSIFTHLLIYIQDFINFLNGLIFWRSHIYVSLSCSVPKKGRVVQEMTLQAFYYLYRWIVLCLRIKICFVNLHNYVWRCVTRTEIDFCIMKVRNVPVQLLHHGS